MIYRQMLVMRKALLWYVGLLAAGMTFMLSSVAMGTTQVCGTSTNFAGWAMTCGYTVMLFAAIYGAGLGNASREGARVFWVLPQGRFRTALGLLGVDIAGVIVAFGIAFLGTALFFSIAIPMEHSDCQVISNLTLPKLALAVGFPLAVYGWSTLTGMLLRRVAYMGIVFLPVGLLWYSFSTMHNGFGALLRSIAFLNPFNMFPANGVWQIWAILFGTLALALAVWQRAEVVA